MANTLNLGTDGNWATKDGSLLGYNSENGNFKPLPFNFTRSTSATRVNKEGLIEVVPNNEPRIDFLNDSKGALLLEPSRSNLVPYSQEFTGWDLTNAVETPNALISPDGTQNASKFVTNNNGVDIKYASIPVIQDTTYTFSFYCNYIGGLGLKGRFYDNTNGANIEYYDYMSQLEEGKWKRVTRTFTTPIGCTNIQVWYLAGSSSNPVTAYYWGAQLEEGSYATSYIPTQGSIGTRVAETASQTVPDGIINSSEGVLYAEVKALVNESVSKYITLNNGTSTNDRVSILLFEDEMQIRLTVGGVEQVNFSHTPTSITDYNKIAFSFKENESKFFVNGTQIGVTDTSCSTSTAGTLDTLRFDFGNGVAAKFNGKVKDLIVYDTALTDAELATLTTI